MLLVTVQNNHKYSSRNVIKRLLLERFLDHIAKELNANVSNNILDFGCGSGVFWKEMLPRLHKLPEYIQGIDQDPEAIKQANSLNLPNAHFTTNTNDTINPASKPLDFVVCLEVLEHLHDPRKWLKEMCALNPKLLLLSVPNEPWFRISQMLSGNNWSRWGNDADHVQNWSAGAFKKLITEYIDIMSISTQAFPFTIVLGNPKVCG